MTLNTPVKIVIAIVVTAVIAALFYVFDWRPKQEELAKCQKDLSDKQARIQELQAQMEELPRLNQEKKELLEKRDQVINTNLVPEKAELFVANYIMEIEKLTAEERERMGDPTFEIISITPGELSQSEAKKSDEENSEEENADEGGAPEALKQFPTRMFQMSMKGRYSTLVDFLYQLGALRLERLVTINKIALTPNGGEEPGMVPTLSITIPITAYMRQGG
jgi:Tfp pilus assembly protein PilO